MRYLLSLILISISLFLFSQGFVARHSLPGGLTHLSKSIFETTSGNYFASGIVVKNVNGSPTNFLSIMGMGSQGQLLWTKQYESTKFEYLDNYFTMRSCYKQGSFIYYVCCALDSTYNKYVGVLMKFNLTGDSLWQRVYRDPLDDVIPQMITGSVDGGFYITGFFQDSSYIHCMLIKTDINGKELWRQKIAKVIPDVQDGKAIVQDSASKKIVIIGYQYLGTASSFGNYDNILVLDSLGNKLYQQNYAGHGAILEDIIQTKDKNFVAVGSAFYPQTIGGENTSRSYIVKFDINNPSGYIWRINDFDKLVLDNGFTNILELLNGDLLIGGGIDTMILHNRPENDLTRFVRMTTNGNVLWTKYYDYNTAPGHENDEAVIDSHLTNDNGWVGAIQIRNIGNNPFLFVKYDSTGCDSSIIYCQMIADGLSKNYLNKSSFTLFPNPSNGLVTIRNSDAGQNALLTLVVLDICGREVKNTTLEADIEKQTVDFKNLNNGVYMITIRQEGLPVYKTKFIKD